MIYILIFALIHHYLYNIIIRIANKISSSLFEDLTRHFCVKPSNLDLRSLMKSSSSKWYEQIEDVLGFHFLFILHLYDHSL